MCRTGGRCNVTGAFERPTLTSLLLSILAAGSFLPVAICLPDVPCEQIDLRNDPIANKDEFRSLFLEQWANCTVIEGNVAFVLMTNTNLTESDYGNFQLPNVREITGYVLLFQVEGLPTLHTLFPNLRVIRGASLIYNYALVIYQSSLRHIGLHNLAVIEHGSVRIAENKHLCNTDSVNWLKILAEEHAHSQITMELNQDPNFCETCKQTHEDSCEMIEQNDKEVLACWDGQHCQQKFRGVAKCNKHLTSQADEIYVNRTDLNHEPTCCHVECLGGCMGPTDGDCYACKHVNHQGRCLFTCPKGFYTYQNRRCITADECHRIPPKLGEYGEQKYFKALSDGSISSCTLDCPSGYEDPENNRTICVKCAGTCKKKCHGATITGTTDSGKFSGCNIVIGHLDIKIKGKNIVQTMEEHFKDIEEVTDHVRITFSHPFVTLSILKNLKLIRGVNLWDGKYALAVFENANLASLWDIKKGGLEVLRGGIRFQNNPKLCPRVITDFTSAIEMHNNSAMLIAPDFSNGNEVICEEVEITIGITGIYINEIVFIWGTFNTSEMDDRSFLGYKLFYRETETENISIKEGRDACSDKWQFMFYEPKERGGMLPHLKPHTLYAVYLTTLMINSPGAKGGISKLIFARTRFSPPSKVPIKETKRLSPNSVLLKWDPPEEPNGVITHYRITYTGMQDYLAPGRLYCENPPTVYDEKDERDAVEKKLEKGPESCSKYQCCDCATKPLSNQTGTAVQAPDKKAIEAKQEKNDFENMLHNVVFVAKNCDDNDETSLSKLCGVKEPNSTGSEDLLIKRHKRAIDTTVLQRSGNEIPTSRLPTATSKTPMSFATLRLTTSSNTTDSSNEIPAKATPTESPKAVQFQSHTLNVTGHSHVLANLSHFTAYEIKIWACQNVSEESNYCSESQAVKIVRTHALHEMDRIDQKSIKIIKVLNDTKAPSNYRLVKWDLPKDPNGIIVSIEFTTTHLATKSPVPYPKCLELSNYTAMSGGILLKDLEPGNWSVQLRIRSLSSYGPFTDPVYFQVDGPFQLSLSMLVVIAVISSLVIIVVGILVVMCVYRRKVESNRKKVILEVRTNPDYITTDDFYQVDEWELSREDIAIKDELGDGAFGKVHYGVANNVKSFCGVFFNECAIKTIRGTATGLEVIHFLREASCMKRFRTAPYIVRLYGVVSQGQPVMVVMEFMAKGNLKDYLKSRRPDADENIHNLPPPTLNEVFQWAGQIADGMAYLENEKYCHRDLAARNCLVIVCVTRLFIHYVVIDEVSANGDCKIGDFGMTRDVYVTEYYRPSGKRMMPARWMAPESLRDHRFTSKSDVWSYGVVLWEIVTLASTPYAGLENDEVLTYVRAGKIMPRPKNCPDFMYTLMEMCWKFHPKDRPSFVDIVELFLPKTNDAFKKESFYCTVYAPSMGNRTPKLPSALVSVAAGVNKTDGEALLPSTVPTIPDVPESSEPGVPQSRFEGPSALLNEMDQNDSDTPLNPEMGKDDIEMTEPICSNNRRPGLPKSSSTPNYQRSNGGKVGSPERKGLTPLTNGSVSNGHVVT